MLDTLRRRSSSKRAAAMTSQTEENLSNLASYPPPGGLKPYDVPLSSGKCYLSEMPAEVLSRIFLKLDRASLTRCYRLCKDLHEFLTTNSAISLHHTLLCNSLVLNPASLLPPAGNFDRLPPSRSELLSTLRERLTRCRNFRPRRTTDVQFKEDEGNLYEYLEGVLMRGIKPLRTGPNTYVSREVAFYDIRQLGEWEDEPGPPGDPGADNGGSNGESTTAGDDEDEVLEEEQIGRDIRRAKRFDFHVSEFAVDPGQDLLVLVEVRDNSVGRGSLAQRRPYTMRFHLFSLETLEYHPLARKPVLEWPHALSVPKIELGFQICDDGLFVLKHHRQFGPQGDSLYGWQWTTGRLGMVLSNPNGISSLESFVLLSPSAFVVPTIVARLDPHADTHNDLNNPDDLVWTHSLMLYAFPPFSSIPEVDGVPLTPPHTATHVASIDLPEFFVDLRRDIPPPRMSARTDPPPRHTLPTHPQDSANPFAPTPESGVFILEFHCQVGHDEPHPHFTMCMQKTTLTQYLPAPTSPVLKQAFSRPAPVVPWSTIAPHVRMFGPDLHSTSWVCYVYQNRYVTIDVDMEQGEQYVKLYDFDPLRVRKEICDRKYGNPPVAPADTIEEVEAGSSRSPTRSAAMAAVTALFPDRRPSANPQASVSKGKGEFDGDWDGIVLVTKETKIAPNTLLPQGIPTGSALPYMYVRKRTRGDNALIDGERIVIVHEDEMTGSGDLATRLEVMEF